MPGIPLSSRSITADGRLDGAAMLDNGGAEFETRLVDDAIADEQLAGVGQIREKQLGLLFSVQKRDADALDLGTRAMQVSVVRIR